VRAVPRAGVAKIEGAEGWYYFRLKRKKLQLIIIKCASLAQKLIQKIQNFNFFTLYKYVNEKFKKFINYTYLQHLVCFHTSYFLKFIFHTHNNTCYIIQCMID
jgi:hypothetical protein